MHGATMHGATMHGATMHGATMHGATIHGATMHGATMHGATIKINYFKFYVYHLLQKTQLGNHAKATRVSLVKILVPFCFF
jgi:uncharacterized protein YjbI with pentapeptide repeats